MSSSPSLSASAQRDSLPLGGLLALASAGFITTKLVQDVIEDKRNFGIFPVNGHGKALKALNESGK